MPGLYARLPLKPTEDLSYPTRRGLVHRCLTPSAPAARLDADSSCGTGDHVAKTNPQRVDDCVELLGFKTRAFNRRQFPIGLNFKASGAGDFAKGVINVNNHETVSDGNAPNVEIWKLFAGSKSSYGA